MRERLGCLIGLHPRWVPVRGDDGGVAWVCGNCGKTGRGSAVGTARGKGWFVPSGVVLGVALVLGIALGIGFASLGGEGDRQPGGDPSAAAEQQVMENPAAGETSGAGSGAGSDGTSAEASLAECRALYAHQVPVALAADSSLDQWRQHIDAMNRLVAGDITLAQATAYWNDTRLGAYHKADRFQDRYRALATSDLTCDAPADAQASTPAERRLVECHAANTAFTDAMTAAEMAIMTWVQHIHDMDALRAGQITPAQATAMWTKNWKLGAQQLKTYDQKARQALRHTCD